MSSPSCLGRYQRRAPWLTRNLLGISAASFLAELNIEMSTVVLPLFLCSILDHPAFALGVIEGAADGLSSLVGLLACWYTDRRGTRRGVAALGQLLMSVSIAGLALASSWTHVLVGRTLEWVGWYSSFPNQDAMLADSTPPDLLGRAFAWKRFVEGLGGIGGPLLATACLSWFDARAILLLSTIPGLMAVAFKFISFQNFMQALIRTVEGSIRAFVATQRQAEILSLRREIVESVKSQVDHALEDWGFHLLDLQINDITFDQAILDSMSRVVASIDLKAAAENEGMALLITKTRAAEADGRAIKIAAEAEREASRLRGEGLALFREQVAHGLRQAAEEMRQGQLDSSLLLLTLWVDAIKSVADSGKGATIYLDGSINGLEGTLKQLVSLQQRSKG